MPVEESLQRNITLRGQLEQHQFDYVLTNGAPRDVVQTLAVEGAQREASKREVDALAWAIDDVRKVDDTPIDGRPAREDVAPELQREVRGYQRRRSAPGLRPRP